jgi:pyridoxamine 5'-phosphate oxidase
MEAAFPPRDMQNSDDPIRIFRAWYEAAARAGIDKPNAMTLATTDADNRPRARVVLLSSYDERGFVFHTNYRSDKGEELARNPWASLVFWWDPLGYQVRIEGRVEPTTPAESDAYFARRPRGSQIGAWASEQSRALESRAALEARAHELERMYAGRAVPRPPHWGGYRVAPHCIEFWENRENRLHDRRCYRRAAGGIWQVQRLAP